MSATYKERIVSMALMHKDQALFHESTLFAEIVEEGAGEFIELKQHSDKENIVRIDPDEVEPLFQMLKKLSKECRE